MVKEFTKENLDRLKELYNDLSFKGEQLEGKFGANLLNPFELLNQTAINTIRTLLRGTKDAAKDLDNLDEWSLSAAQTTKQNRLKAWAEFLNLLIGYRLDQDEKATKKAEKAKAVKELKARIAVEKDKNLSVDDLEKKLAALEVE